MDQIQKSRIILNKKRDEEAKEPENEWRVSGAKKVFRSNRIAQITKRDLEILRFILDMKFADLRQIHQKFFSQVSSGKRSHSLKWASNRLRGLKKEGLLLSQSGLGGSKHYFIVTARGRMFLQGGMATEDHLQALKGIDIRTFDHDHHVVNARIALEKLGRAVSWDSERRMKAGLSPSFNLNDQFLPDGIYRNAQGHSIAFELEIAIKEPKRYVQKVEKYMDAFRRSSGGATPLMGAVFVATSKIVFQKLSSAVSKYPSYFRVERYLDLVSSAEENRDLVEAVSES